MDAHSLNLNCRSIAQALGRAEELTRTRNWGTQAANTWKNTTKVQPSIPHQHVATVQSLFTNSFNIDTVTQLISLLKKILAELQTQDKQSRVKAWKRKLMQSENLSYQWLKNQPQDNDISMKLPTGKFTANTDEQLNEIAKAWLPIFQKFVNCLPDMKHFDENFAPFMKSHPMTLTPMTGSFLVQTLKNVKPSSSSLDGWRPVSLIALSRWYPDLFNGLAMILDWIELNARWPSPLTKAYTALIPKDGMGDAPSPVDFRPISVLSAIYWLWAKARFQDSLNWQEFWAHKEMWGCRKGRGTQGMIMAIAQQLEQEGMHSDCVVGGGAYDFKKCFDLIPFQLLFRSLEIRGAHPRILMPLQFIYQNLTRVF